MPEPPSEDGTGQPALDDALVVQAARGAGLRRLVEGVRDDEGRGLGTGTAAARSGKKSSRSA